MLPLDPNTTVGKITGLPRWQRDWINSHRSINYSGLVQELIIKVIQEKDPEYYEKFKHLIDERQCRRRESLMNINIH